MAKQHQPPPRPDDMKQRVNRCMIKLSDRDTEPMAVSELESIARSLAPDSLPPFLSAISDTRPSDKTPLRRHSLRLISVLSHSHPPSALLPHLPRMLSAALRRIRDSDSSVRSACVDAVGSMAASNPNSVSSVLLRPLADALLHEQGQCAQMASALCLAAAIDAAAEDSDLIHQLQKLVPRLLKLLKSNAFKAKPALISLLGSAAGAGGASTQNLIGMLVPCLTEFLAGEDWAVRKAAAEALSRVGLTDRDLLGGLKSSCISSFESRRFDKVKIVRDSMNRMLEVWKDIPAIDDGGGDDSRTKQHANSSRRESASDGRFPVTSVNSASVQSSSPFISKKNRISASRSPPPNPSPIATTRKKNPPSTERKSYPPSSCKTNNNSKNSDWKVEIAVSNSPTFSAVSEEKFTKSKENNGRSKFEAKRMLFENNSEEKATKLGGGLKLGSRVVPFEESGSSEVITAAENANDELHGEHKDGDLNLIRRQLLQIENQQSSLLDLLQRFIGSSQKGIHSLETRVHGLEMVLDEISHDLAISSGRLSNSDPAVKTCCSLPGAEFLSPKFWRRTDGGRYSLSGNPTMAGVRILAEQQGGKYPKQGAGLQKSLVVNPLAGINPQSRGNTEVTPNKMLKNVIHDARNG